jgi:iron-sulfur cluster repair protein YtfE (RIC family)
MDLIDQLTSEHREAENLLARLKETDPGSARDQLVDELTAALRTHMAVEERFVYPVVAETLGEEPEEEAEVEHQLAREGLQKLDQLRSEPGFGAAVDMVEAGIAHHVQEEEKEIFPKLRQEAADQIAELDPEECKSAVASDTIDLTKEELYRQAQKADIDGRSSMTKEELAQALADR